MTTLTIYFASSPALPASSSAPTAAALTNTITTTIPSIQIVQKLTKPIPIPSPPRITLPTPILPIRTQLPCRKSSKRNKTFFERFSDTSSSTHLSSPQSPGHQPQQQQEQQQQQQHQQSTDSSNPSLEPAPRLRRRFTFRRSLRHSVHSKGGEIDDGISFDVDGSSSSPRGALNSHHNVSPTSALNQQHGTANKTASNTTNSSGMHRRESFLYKCDSDNDLSPKCISRNPSIGSEL
ncbi:unnamed protein product [Adineta steineri]|uniref:Uncharacterized protein n=1 Tax=Adineta steineri TaxID=433720 RepID=A0A813SXF8_9BILA|nr:unnamed protein product [Adineta steineri]